MVGPLSVNLAPGLTPLSGSACVRPAFGLRSACVRPAFGLRSACVRPASGLVSVRPLRDASGRLKSGVVRGHCCGARDRVCHDAWRSDARPWLAPTGLADGARVIGGCRSGTGRVRGQRRGCRHPQTVSGPGRRSVAPSGSMAPSMDACRCLIRPSAGQPGNAADVPPRVIPGNWTDASHRVLRTQETTP